MADRTTKVTLVAEVSQYVAGMEKASTATKGTASEAQQLAGKQQGLQMLGGVAVAIGAAMTAVGIAVAKTGIEYNTLQQTSRAALTTLLGGAEAANEQMDKLDAFARTSPFSKSVFISAQQQMLAFGIETKKVIPYLDAVQNAVAAAGGSNADIAGLVATMSKIQSASKITAQDLMEFGNRGVNAAELIGLQMGKTGAQIRADITSGSIGATEALDALAAGMSTKFEGASANVKKTFEGAMDRVRAAWRDTSADLMKPLVDPNGGGALIDLLNWTADIVRGFQGMPEPVKLATGAVGAASGVVLLAGGTFLLAVPKIHAFKDALSQMGTTAQTTGRVLGGIGKGVGIVAGIAAAVGIADAFAKSLRDVSLQAKEMLNSLSTGGESAQMLGQALDQVASSFDSGWAGIFASTLDAATFQGGASDMRVYIKGIGTELAALPADEVNDYFVKLRDELKLTDAQMTTLINSSPELKSSLTDAATAAGVAADDHTLLKIALGEIKIPMKDAAKASDNAADAYLNAADEASGLDDKLAKLIGTINEANGVGQDAISANIDYQDALQGVRAQVEQITAGTEGYSATLDIATVAGRDNYDVLLKAAEAGQKAAAAQLTLDGNTQGYATALQTNRDTILQNAIDLGATDEQVQFLADHIVAMPTQKEIELIAVTQPARIAFEQLINDYNGRQISMSVALRGGASRADLLGNETGGMYESGVRAFATGGFPSGVYAGGQNIHKFAETGLPWETYISPKPGYERENIGYALESLRRLGALDGPASAPAQSSGPTLIYKNYANPGFTAEQELWRAMDRRRFQ